MLHAIRCNTERNEMHNETSEELGDICWTCLYKEIASRHAGDVGVALFNYYDAINWHFFDNKLPQAFLLTALTAYGACIGLTEPDPHKLPTILIHPTLKTEEDRFYTVLHEATHVYVRYVLGVTSYGSKTSHSNPAWIAEVNRLAKLLGYTNIEIGFNKVTREKKEDGGKIKRAQTGSVPYSCSYSFPHTLEKETGQPLPPIEQWLKD